MQTAAHRRLRALTVPCAAVVAALALSAPVSASTTTASPAPSSASPSSAAPLTAQGIIMRDGGICDPIRHMGC